MELLPKDLALEREDATNNVLQNFAHQELMSQSGKIVWKYAHENQKPVTRKQHLQFPRVV